MGPEDFLVTRIYGQAVLRQIAEACEADPTREACGFVVRRGGALEVVQVQNVADQYHGYDAAAFPRTSRDSYLMDPRALLCVQEDAAVTGGEIVAVWHSHVEVGAYFSAKDRADAVVDGIQLVPGADYLVFSVQSGRAVEGKCFHYEAGGFPERSLGPW